MRRVEYDRQKAKEYAKKWAYSRNPAYILRHILMIHITEKYLHMI